ncbi:MAG: hypothetical protein HYX77_02415 [Acidobacteria bacterium]|nr:hypothetical protein [Acidobacteriota bacterium]
MDSSAVLTAVARLAVEAATLTEPAIAADARSRIMCTVGRGASVDGALWPPSSQPGAFSAAHRALMDGAAETGSW